MEILAKHWYENDDLFLEFLMRTVLLTLFFFFKIYIFFTLAEDTQEGRTGSEFPSM